MNLLQRVRERFWFLPAVLCLLAFVLAEALITFDEWLGGLSVPPVVDLLLYRVGESGSRDILGAIASSSLAVAGTTFSITMAVLALTSSSYGPRLVRNFMADRGNQTVLGVYVATFLYSLLVLRSIRVLGDPGDQQGEVFVPHLAVNGAVLLGVANVGVLIYFIHHISDSIQISTLASGVRADLRKTVHRLYPSQVGHDRSVQPDAAAGGAAAGGAAVELARVDGAPVTAGRAGYVQSVDADDLVDAAGKHDAVLALRVRPGQYVLDDTVVCLVHPADRAGPKLQEAVRSAVQVADARSPHQDVEFAVQQLTEMAVRALSPGTNDPYTAINALDDLSVGLSLLAARQDPSPERYDGDGVLRVHAPHADAADLVGSVLDGMRWYATSHPSVMHAALRLVARVGEHARDPGVRTRLLDQVSLMRDAFDSAGHHDHDVRQFADHAERVSRDLRSRLGGS